MSELSLQLGDFIRIESPSNTDLNERLFFIQYIDEEQMELMELDTLRQHVLSIRDNRITDESIISIIIVNRANVEGYVKQNDYNVGDWIDIHFGGNSPFTITGEITTIEKDMIEVRLIDKTVIYIDFEYKGLPKYIREIVKRSSPSEVMRDESREDDESIAKVDISLDEVLKEGDELEFGDDLGELDFVIQLDEKNYRYPLSIQTDDLLNELLSNVPNQENQYNILSRVNRMISRFVQLRTQFSTHDKLGDITGLREITSTMKPLVDVLYSMKKQVGWMLPIVSQINKLYSSDYSDKPDPMTENIQSNYDDYTLDKDKATLRESIEQLNRFYKNQLTGDQNKYEFLVKRLNELNESFQVKEDKDKEIATVVDVKENMDTIVDNLSQLHSSLFKYKKLTIGNRISRYLTNFSRVQEDGSVMIILPEKVHLKGVYKLPETFVRYFAKSYPSSSILDKSNACLNYPMIWEAVRENKGREKLFHKREKLNDILPTNEQIIDALPSDSLYSVERMIKRMSVYLVESDDITFKGYRKAIELIDHQIRTLKRQLQLTHSTALKLMKNANGSYQEQSKDVSELYNITDGKTTSEVLSITLNVDQNRHLSAYLKRVRSQLEQCVDIQEKLQTILDSMKEEDNDIENEDTRRSIMKRLIREMADSIVERERSVQENTSRPISLETTKSLRSYLEFDKYSREKYLLQLNNVVSRFNLQDMDDEDIVRSPYEKIRDDILGDSDFSRKMTNMRRFVDELTVPAYQDQDNNWLYCIDTGVKLVPSFFADLAFSFFDGTYDETLKKICTERGEISADGDKWVDKHSGYTIRMIDYDEENYFVVGPNEDGVIEDDLGVLEDKKEENNFKKSVRNAIETILTRIGIQLLPQSVDTIIERVVTRYNQNRDKLKSIKQKSNSKYQRAKNQITILSILIFVIFAIQTERPIVKSSMTFPGCKRDFLGWPLDKKGDTGLIEYIACVADKIKTNTAPWSGLHKRDSQKIIESLKKTIEEMLNSDEYEYLNKELEQKRIYMKEHPEEMEDEPVLSTEWTTFMPPLFGVVNIPDIKVDEDNLKSSRKLNNLENLIQLSSLHLISEIQEVINGEQLLMVARSNGTPYVENNCCSVENMGSFNYFIDKKPRIGKLVKLLKKLHKFRKSFDDENTVYVDDRDTKINYGIEKEEYTETVIYQAIHTLCGRYKEQLQETGLCHDLNIDSLMSVEEKVLKIKESGISYTEDNLKTVLQIVNRVNKVEIIEKQDENKWEEVISKIDGLLDEPLLTILRNNTESNMIYDYVESGREELKDNISRIVSRYVSKKQLKNIFEYDLKEKNTKSETFTSNFLFLKNILRSLTSVYPSRIQHDKHEPSSVIPSYWKLSDRHKNIVEKIIRSLYGKINNYNDDVINLHLKSVIKYSVLCEFANEIIEKYDKKTVISFMNYMILFVYNVFLNGINDNELEEQGVSNEIEQDEGNTEKTKEITSKLISTIEEIIQNERKSINYNEEIIQNRIIKLKDKEKEELTRELREMSEQKRRIQMAFKQSKLGRWNIALQKGITRYDKATFDKEIQDLEEQMKRDIRLGKNPDVVDMNRDILDMEMFEQDLIAEQIERDEYKMQPDNDDDYGDADGDEHF
jgi:hypothetical protein